MFYRALGEKKSEALDKCINISKLILMISTTTFTFLTFIYLKELVEGLEKLDFNQTFGLFQELKECIIRSHICG